MIQSDIQELADKYLLTKSNHDFRKLYNRLLPGIRKFINPYLRNITVDKRELTMDIINNTFYKMLINLHQYNDAYNFSSWIYGIVRNETLTELKIYNSKKDNIQYDAIVKNTENEEAYHNINVVYIENLQKFIDCTDYFAVKENEEQISILYQKISEKIQKLPKIYSDVLYDREIFCLNYNEISVKRNISLQTVKNRIRLGREMLKRNINGNLKKIYQELEF